MNSILERDIEIFTANPTLNIYQTIALKSAIYPGRGTPIGLMYVALKGAGEAGEFAEHVGKALRDDNLLDMDELDEEFIGLSVSPLTPERRDKLIKEIGDQLWYLAAKCQELGITLGDAAHINLQKLASRTARGKLQGSGDDR